MGSDEPEFATDPAILWTLLGRHRCIGESFAYVQIKSIAATMLRNYKISLPSDGKGGVQFPEPDYTRLFVLPKGECLMTYERR